jgi:hypothetical protein
MFVLTGVIPGGDYRKAPYVPVAKARGVTEYAVTQHTQADKEQYPEIIDILSM